MIFFSIFVDRWLKSLEYVSFIAFTIIILKKIVLIDISFGMTNDFYFVGTLSLTD